MREDEKEKNGNGNWGIKEKNGRKEEYDTWFSVISVLCWFWKQNDREEAQTKGDEDEKKDGRMGIGVEG